ncbi:NADPH:quinone reductase [Bordetella sp. LUAb4]|uniref:NADPH:quinone reductase n=1 Tax=Bordetella sp. LUAb4 TaxID=2843195 RepID=UPI001E545D17|nr:NADPH:quinone reductase [Bordetella sp. LUAb4]
MPLIPATMRAAWISQRGPADQIRVEPIAVPAPGPSDVLVRVQYAAVNPIDTFVRSGQYITPLPFPFVIGRDMVGTVAALGDGASRFAIGDTVWTNSLGHEGRQGCTAEFAVVASDRLYPLAREVDPAVAIGVFHPAATAYLAMTTHARTQAGDTVYIAGGGGHVGSAAIAMAVLAGARVIASAAPADHDYCRGLGADVVLDYRDEGLAQKIAAAAPDGIDVHLNTSGRHDLQGAVDMLAHGGRVVLMSGLKARPELPVGGLYTRDASILGFAISNASTSDLQAAANRVNQLLVQGTLPLRKTEVLPLAEAARAHQRMEAGEVQGIRLILKP